MSSVLHAAASAVPATRGRILVVEDDPVAAYFFSYVLTKRGRFHVTHTADPAAALALAAAGPWDLVITDLDLPVMSGLELLAGLRRLVPQLPVVLATAHPEHTALAALGRGPDKILRKPVPAADLLSTVSALTAGSAR